MNLSKNFKKDGIIFHQGSPSDCAFIIGSGSVAIVQETKEGEKILGNLKENDIFGEMGLIDGFPRSASVIALEDCTISIITQDSFNNLAQHKPEALMPILKVLAKRLRSTLTLVEDLQKGKSPSA